MFEDLLPAWGGEEVVVRFDEPSATWMFIGVHSTVLGPGAGGTRMKTYAQPADGLRDVLRLSSAMTSKMAMASVPLGGGKAVLAVPEIPQGQARRELMLRYGDLVESLHGTYITACDMNTGTAGHGRDRRTLLERPRPHRGQRRLGHVGSEHGRRRVPRDPGRGRPRVRLG